MLKKLIMNPMETVEVKRKVQIIHRKSIRQLNQKNDQLPRHHQPMAKKRKDRQLTSQLLFFV